MSTRELQSTDDVNSWVQYFDDTGRQNVGNERFKIFCATSIDIPHRRLESFCAYLKYWLQAKGTSDVAIAGYHRYSFCVAWRFTDHKNVSKRAQTCV
jgi:hypothetical protein